MQPSARHALFRSMWLAGHGLRAISEATGYSWQYTRFLRGQLGLPTRAERGPRTETKTARVLALRAEGKTYNQIASETGISAESARVLFSLANKRAREVQARMGGGASTLPTAGIATHRLHPRNPSAAADAQNMKEKAT